MKAYTVCGDIPAEDLGITLCHEHFLIDVSGFALEAKGAFHKALFDQPVHLEILGDLRRNPYLCRDNLCQLDIGLAIKEFTYFKRAGGKTVVDCTPIGLGRDVIALKTISEATGLNIVAGTGFYVDNFHPKYVNEKSDEELASQMISEIQHGVGDSGVRCGIIGEIGTGGITGEPVASSNEKKVLRAAVYAQQKTGAPISIHVWPWGKNAHAILDILQDEGANLERVVLDHTDKCGYDPEYTTSLAQRGCYIAFDNFGSEQFLDPFSPLGFEPRDAERVAGICELTKRGYVSQVLLSHDICFKILLKSLGGYGYDHLLTHILPMFRKSGLTKAQINLMFVENPKRLLGF